MQYAECFHIDVTFRYADAEKDCSRSLCLDDSNIKAYFRRATARTKLNKLEDAKQGREIEWYHLRLLLTSCYYFMPYRLSICFATGFKEQRSKGRASEIEK